MPKSFQQKMKILYLMRAFLEKTDEKHPMTVKDIQAYLGEVGINVERKTIYDDIECLRVFGMDIVNRREKPAGSYLAKRDFELAELKPLMDAVQSSKFITSGKARQLLSKLEKLTDSHQARELRRQILPEPGIRAVNENIYRNIEEIHRAISEDRQISFQYCEWTLSKELRLKREGERYRISPWRMVWRDDHYYLVALDAKSGIVKHYRVDKMQRTAVEKESRSGREIFENFDEALFASGTFGMFGGREETVSLLFENRLVGVVIDRFGQDTMIVGKDEGHFTASVKVHVSGQFYGWLAGLGCGVRILSPDSVRREYQDFLQRALASTMSRE